MVTVDLSQARRRAHAWDTGEHLLLTIFPRNGQWKIPVTKVPAVTMLKLILTILRGYLASLYVRSTCPTLYSRTTLIIHRCTRHYLHTSPNQKSQSKPQLDEEPGSASARSRSGTCFLRGALPHSDGISHTGINENTMRGTRMIALRYQLDVC